MQILKKFVFPGSNDTDIFIEVILNTQVIYRFGITVCFQKLLCEFFKVIHAIPSLSLPNDRSVCLRHARSCLPGVSAY